MHKFLSTLLIFFLYLTVKAQNPPQITQPTILYPSPTAMQFQKYGDYPVSNFTGVPDITIPLYTIKEGDLSLPITMTYHASGIKVTDQSGFFGAGWTLNTGGLVTQTIIGNAEDDNNFPTTVPTVASINPCGWNAYSETLVQLEQMEEQGDIEHDVFFYNLGSESGKFYQQGGQQAPSSLYPYRPIKVVPFPSGWKSYEILDEKGVKHFFGQDGVYGSWDPAQGTNTWYASHIISGLSDSNEISFKYSSPIHEYRVERHETYTRDDNPPPGDIAPPTDLPYYVPDLETGSATTTVDDYSYTELPTEIDFTLGKITFSYDPTTNQLSTMTIYKADGSVYQRILFSIAPFPNQQPDAPSTPAWYKLSAIKFYDGNGNFINQYQLGYNPGVIPPYINTNGVDYWGYFNGKPNTDLMPNDPSYTLFWNAQRTSISIGGADRTADGNSMALMSLDTVVYPTGGMSVFTFEPNRYKFAGVTYLAGGLRIQQITNYDYPGHIAQVKSYTYSDGVIDIVPNVTNYFYNQVGLMEHLLNCFVSYPFRRTIYSSDPDVDFTPHGSPVVYPSVTETISDGANTIGSTRYDYAVGTATYTTFPVIYDNQFDYTTYQYKTYRADQKDWDLGGELLDKSVYDKNGNWISDENYNYQEHIRDSLLNFKIYRFALTMFDPEDPPGDYPTFTQNDMDYAVSCPNNGGALMDPYAYTNYWTITGEKRLMSKDIYIADQRSNQLTLDEHTDYQYGNDSHDQPTQETTTDSKGRTVQTNYKYPADFSSTSPYNTMLAENKQTEVIQQDQYINNSFLQTIKTNYKDWGNGVIAPDSVQVKKLNGPMEPRLIYGGYDGRGNLLSVYKPGDMTTSYIWDYRHLRPIAQVKNAGITDVAYTSFEADGGGNWTFAGTPQADASAITGKQSYNLSTGSVTRTGLNAGTTYIVSYWSKNGAYSVTGGNTLTTGRTSNTGWTYYEHSVTSQTSITVSGSGQIDELRLYPNTAQMSTFTYDPLVGQTSSCDAASKITYYQYDAAGRLDMILDQDKNILKKYAYAYQQPLAQGKGSDWENDGNRRYVPCSINPAFNSQEIQYEQKDYNPLSATYNQTQWVDGGKTTTTWPTDWQWTNNYQCVQDNGQNTGEQQRQQVYANPCSNIYNQTQWVSLGTNTTACPLPNHFTSDDESGDYYSQNCSDPAQPDAYYVSVPQGMFTSSVSLQDADNQATSYAQNIANQQGTCTIPNFNLFWQNNAHQIFNVDLVNEATGVTYSFFVPSGFDNSLGTIPEGTYDIHVFADDDSWGGSVSVGYYYGTGADQWIYGVYMVQYGNDTIYTQD